MVVIVYFTAQVLGLRRVGDPYRVQHKQAQLSTGKTMIVHDKNLTP